MKNQLTNAIVVNLKKGKSKELKEKTSVPILVFLTNTTLILVTTMHCELDQKLQNDKNVVKFKVNILNSLV